MIRIATVRALKAHVPHFVAWVLLIAGACALGLLTSAQAEWPQGAFSCKAYRADLYWRDWARRHCRGYRWHRRVWTAPRWQAPVTRYVTPSVPRPGSQHCPGTIINVVSSERQGVDKAKGDARKMFMEAASTRHGLAYTELGYAKHVRWRCFPAQSHDTWTGKLSKGANILMGGDGQNMRCELWAAPCSVPIEAEE